MTKRALQDRLMRQAIYKSGNSFYASDVAKNLGVTDETARDLLGVMIRNGLASKVGDKYQSMSQRQALLRRPWV